MKRVGAMAGPAWSAALSSMKFCMVFSSPACLQYMTRFAPIAPRSASVPTLLRLQDGALV